MIPSARKTNEPVEVVSMRALDPEVMDAVWEAIEALIPSVPDTHPLGVTGAGFRTGCASGGY